jgi:hypothetical protein
MAVAVRVTPVVPDANALATDRPFIGSDIPPPLGFQGSSLPLLV